MNINLEAGLVTSVTLPRITKITRDVLFARKREDLESNHLNETQRNRSSWRLSRMFRVSRTPPPVLVMRQDTLHQE